MDLQTLSSAGVSPIVMTSDEILEAATRLVLKHTPGPDVFPSPVPGLTLYRITSQTFIERSAGELLSTFIIQGRKSTAIGGKVLEYGPGESLVSGIASPSEFHTLDSSPEHPFLAISVSLDLSILMEYAGMLDGTKHSEEVLGGVFVIRPDEDLAIAFLGLLRLLERPELIPIRAPLQIRELHALLLDSSCGNQLRTLACAGSAGHSVLKAVNWIRKNYASACSGEELAERANMSLATFYRKFRQVTGSSPVQFRKKVRLFEARRILLAREANAASAAYKVGYESATQFTRDYKAAFGASPIKDIKRLAG